MRERNSPFSRAQCIALLKACGWEDKRFPVHTTEELQQFVRNRRNTNEISDELMAQVLNNLLMENV